MKINFTKNEYRSLIEMFEMVSWVISSHLDNPDNEPEKYKELAQ